MSIVCPPTSAPHPARAPRALTLRAPLVPIVRTLKSHARPIILGASGGIDSTAAMLLLAHAQHPTLVVHIHHHLRDDADNDAHMVAKQSKLLGFPHITVHLPPPSDTTTENLSARSRRLRYDALSRYAQRFNADILTAHHADDQFETFVMRLLRGTALPQAFGLKPRMQWNEQSVLRPLLSLWKRDLRLLVTDVDFPWIEDSSNASDDYLRNRLRGRMAPLIEQLSQEAKAAQTLALLAEESAALQNAQNTLPALAAHLHNPPQKHPLPDGLPPHAQSIDRLHALRTWSYDARAFQQALYNWCVAQELMPRRDVLTQISQSLWEGEAMTRDLRGLRLVVTRQALWLAPKIPTSPAFEGGGDAILRELHSDRWTAVGTHRLRIEGEGSLLPLWARPLQPGDRMPSPHSGRMVGVRKRMTRDGVPAAVRDGAVVVLAHSSPTAFGATSDAMLASHATQSPSSQTSHTVETARGVSAEQLVIVGVLHAHNQRLEIRTTPTMHLSVVRAD